MWVSEYPYYIKKPKNSRKIQTVAGILYNVSDCTFTMLISSKDLVDYLKARGDAGNDAVRKVHEFIQKPRAGISPVKQMSNRLVSLFVQYLLRHGMLSYPLVFSKLVRVRTRGGGEGTTEKQYITRIVCESFITANSVGLDALMDTSVIVRASSVYRDTILALADPLTQGVLGASIYLIMPFNGNASAHKYGSSGITEPVISYGPVLSRNMVGDGDDVIDITGQFHPIQIMELFMWMARKYVLHPSITMARLLDATSTPEAYLFGILDDMKRDNRPHRKEIKEFFGIVAVLCNLFIRNDPTFTPSDFNNRLYVNLTKGFNALLCKTGMGYSAHDIIRTHTSFWIEDLLEWLEYESRSDVPSKIEFGIWNIYFMDRHLYYMLRLNVLNVYALLRKLENPYSQTGQRYMYTNDERAAELLVFDTGLNIPDFSSPEYGATSSLGFSKMQDAASELVREALKLLQNRRFGTHSPLYSKGSSTFGSTRSANEQ